MKRNTSIREALDFDDVLLAPAESSLKPSDILTRTLLTKSIPLNIPLISAGLPHVTESAMAIAMARLGGIGIIHDGIPMGKQVEEVRKVKRAQSDMIQNPITIAPNASVAEAFDLMTTYKISGLPVIEQPSQKVVGIITGRDVRFFEDYAKPVSELMSKNVITVKGKISQETAKQLMHQHRIEKLVVVDDQGRCIGLITVKDIETISHFPGAVRDGSGRLRIAGRVSISKDAFDRAAAMTDAGLDAVFVDVPHGHSREVLGLVSRIRQQRSSEVQIIAGKVATGDAARSLIDAGADAVIVGVGAEKGSDLRKTAGVGVPQITAILDVVDQCDLHGIPVIVDGGIHDATTLAKALGAGAHAVIIDDLFAGADEAPGTIFSKENHVYKLAGPEEHTALYQGPVIHMANHLLAGLKVAMAYTGSKDIAAFHENSELIKAG